MGYKPKYAQGKGRPAPIRPEPAPQLPPEPKVEKKRGKGFWALFILLGILIIPASTLATARILLKVGPDLGRPKAAPQAAVGNMTILQKVEDFVGEELADARALLLNTERPDAPEEMPEEVPVETLPPVRKEYWIEDGVQVAPEPNQALFGETEDPATLTDVLKKAEYILEGQKLFFHTGVEIFEGSKVRYYLDDSIFAITWKEPRDGSVYTFSEVKISHPSQLRRHLSDGQYCSGKLYLPTEMAATVNAVVATSGDFYANRPIFGIVAYEGQVRRNVDDGYAETCYIDKNGDMIFSYMGQLKNTQNAQAFLDENEINFSLAFGPILVDTYEVKELGPVYGVGEIWEEYARSALCQMDELHYLIAVANWEGNQPDDPTVPQFQKVIATTGCKMAYCLDGGQTAAVVMNDQLINRPAKGEQRRISDIIYFATAVPEGGGDLG